jgi:hypothetical protein
MPQISGVSPVYLRILARSLPSLLPGLGQAVSRRWRPAAIFAGSAFLLVALALVGYRFPVSDFALLLLPTVVASSFFDQARFGLERWTARRANAPELLGLGFLSMASLFAVVYAAQLAFATQFVRGVAPGGAGPFVRGEELLARRMSPRLADPQPGEWWIADRGGTTAERMAAQLTPGGQSVARVLAGPWEKIAVGKTGILRPDGTAFEALGAGAVVDIPPGEIEIPDGKWLVAEVRWIGNQPHFDFALATRRELAGRIVAVTRPPASRRLVGREP